MSTVRIGAVQAPEFHDDLPGSLQFLDEMSGRAKQRNVELLAFPEGFVQGYIVEEDAARRIAIDLGSRQFDVLLEKCPKSGPMLVFGMIESLEGRLFNTAVVIQNQTLVGKYRKTHLLPREAAFSSGRDVPVFDVQGLRFCINICYDTNFPDLAECAVRHGARLVVCCANNMLRRQTAEKYTPVHNAVRGQRCRETRMWLMSSDVTGDRAGHLALGPTAVLNPKGEVVLQLPLGEVGMLVFDLPNAR